MVVSNLDFGGLNYCSEEMILRFRGVNYRITIIFEMKKLKVSEREGGDENEMKNQENSAILIGTWMDLS